MNKCEAAPEARRDESGQLAAEPLPMGSREKLPGAPPGPSAALLEPLGTAPVTALHHPKLPAQHQAPICGCAAPCSPPENANWHAAVVLSGTFLIGFRICCCFLAPRLLDFPLPLIFFFTPFGCCFQCRLLCGK